MSFEICKVAAGLIAAASLAGCAPRATEENFRRHLKERWTLADADDLVRNFGRPLEVFDMPHGGNRVYVYNKTQRGNPEKRRLQQLGNDFARGGDLAADRQADVAGQRAEIAAIDAEVHHCRIEFEVDTNSQKVVGWRYEGDLCVSQ